MYVVMRMEKLALQILILCFYLGPITYIVADKHSSGNEKNAWLVATMFFSWLAWLTYIAIVPTIRRHRYRIARIAYLKTHGHKPHLSPKHDVIIKNDI